MIDQLHSLIIGCLLGICCIVITCIALRVFLLIAPVKIFFTCIVFSELLLILIDVLFFNGIYIWHASAMIGLFGIINFFLFGAIYKSISLKLLGVLHANPCQCETVDFLVEVVGQTCVDQRMELLVQMGYVEKFDDGTYFPTTAGFKVGSRLKKIQMFFGVYKSGLYGVT